LSLEGNSSLIQTDWESPPINPIDLMKDWIVQAQKAGIAEPLSLTLTTINQIGWSRNRVVLVKEISESSIIFGSSSLSEKGRDIEHNPKVAGNFWWRESVQQIHFRGFAVVASTEKSNQLFQQRSRSAQAVAICSQQSQILESESDLKTKFTALNQSEQPLTRPSTWQAYQITPIEYEFWQGDASRLHKRLRYSLQIPNVNFSQLSNLDGLDLTQGIWIQQRLQP
jgi:dihydrophenazinedicarboxylate synthase